MGHFSRGEQAQFFLDLTMQYHSFHFPSFGLTAVLDEQEDNQCTMAQALKKIGIKDLAKIMTLAPIFSSQNYFR